MSGTLGGDLIAAFASVGAALLGFAGIVKVTRPAAAARALGQIHLPRSAALVRALGMVEVAIAIAWFWGHSPASASALAAAYVCFLAFGLVLLSARGERASCGCLGSADTPITPTHLVYNAAVAAAALAAAIGHVSREVVPTGVLAAGGSIVALGVGTYLSYLLLTEFDGAAKAFGADRGTRGKSDISLITVERRP